MEEVGKIEDSEYKVDFTK